MGHSAEEPRGVLAQEAAGEQASAWVTQHARGQPASDSDVLSTAGVLREESGFQNKRTLLFPAWWGVLCNNMHILKRN